MTKITYIIRDEETKAQRYYLLEVTLLETASKPGNLTPESAPFNTIVYNQSLGQFCCSLAVTHSFSVPATCLYSLLSLLRNRQRSAESMDCVALLTCAMFQISCWGGLATPRSQLSVLMWEIRKSTDYMRKENNDTLYVCDTCTSLANFTNRIKMTSNSLTAYTTKGYSLKQNRVFSLIKERQVFKNFPNKHERWVITNLSSFRFGNHIESKGKHLLEYNTRSFYLLVKCLLCLCSRLSVFYALPHIIVTQNMRKPRQRNMHLLRPESHSYVSGTCGMWIWQSYSRVWKLNYLLSCLFLWKCYIFVDKPSCRWPE